MQKLILQESEQLITQLLTLASPKADDIFILGCSTSEVSGAQIGKSGSLVIAEIIYSAIAPALEKVGVHLAVQCCEHLNRALVVEKSLAKAQHLEIVSAIPTPNAGGSMAAYTYSQMKDPVLVEHIRADLGLDIGDTLIAMHLKHVAVPLRLSVNRIGNAHIVCATTRPKCIGGARTVYENNK